MPVQTARQMTINGDLTAGEDLIIDCTFEGSIQLPGHHLTIASQSQVHAAVSAQVVSVHGTFEGQIEADTLQVTPDANVNATVISRKFTLQEGAVFNGSVNTERARAAAEVAKHRATQRLGEAT